MAEHRLRPPPAHVAAPIVEHVAIEPLPAEEEPPTVDPVLAPLPAPVLAADPAPAPAVETVEEVIFLAILLVPRWVYPLSVALVPTFVSGSFMFSFLVLLPWAHFGKPVYSFSFFGAIVFVLCIVLGLLSPRFFACLCGPLLRFFFVLFLASIFRMFLCLSERVNLCRAKETKKTLVLLLFAYVLH